ncbi:dihydrolipoamide acetyltransferase family protein [Nocardioides daejeonensis]|uniref:dihydrolipoamide acetyltransferase family protein n=1 Tax=Nocardioides daejeonensis TaxID=1046556 RepID=UPI000D749940|nr:dihydrolipoamide acetyltransferase family protein [Nocardioides daejeonensis]
MHEFKLPDVGEGLTEAEIVSWKVKVGDVVEINDVIVEIETAKSLVELPSPFAGTVLALLVPEGQEVPVGTPIIAIGDPSEATSDGVAPGGAPGSAAPEEMEIDLSNPAASGGGEGESLVGRMKADRGPMRRPRKGSASPATESAAATQMQVQGAFSPGGAQSQAVIEADEPAVPVSAPAGVVASAPEGAALRTLAKPPVRKLARDLGVDLTTVTPTGDGGVVTRDDVQAAAAGGMPERYEDAGRPGVSPMAGAREVREPIKGVRKMMAQAMTDSAFSAPHVTEWVTVDVTRSMEFVAQLRSHRDFRDVKVGPLLLLARACLLAMRRTPTINSYWDDAAQEVVLKGYVNLGIAAATPRGLVVPNVKDADAMSMRELATAVNELTAVAREGRTQPADMAGGTFTITNVGVFGVDAGTPIINPGESAILCFGAVKKQPWVVTDAEGNDELAIRQVTTLALSFDHRHIDGEAGSRFLADVAAVMEDPAHALLL